MDSIVLRDRNGKEINYHGIDYLNVKTPDGETQGYAAYDPETLVPENLVSGVVVGDVEGALKVPQAVETTIAPDFSAGDMEVVPEDGQVFSKVGILKPANLFPENIAKDVDIAGVVGTLESGGVGAEILPCIWFSVSNFLECLYVGTENTYSKTVKMSGNFLNCTVVGAYYQTYARNNGLSGNNNNVFECTPTISTSGEVSFTKNWYLSKATQAIVLTLVVLYSVNGLHLKQTGDGVCELIADETCNNIPDYGKLCAGNVSKADLSNATFTEMNTAFRHIQIPEIILPPTVAKIRSYALESTYLRKVDFSKHTSVPILDGYYTATKGVQYLVPSALYDEWIAATGWSNLADYIVAV